MNESEYFPNYVATYPSPYFPERIVVSFVIEEETDDD